MTYNYEPNNTQYYINCIQERIDEKRLLVFKNLKELHRIKPTPLIFTYCKRYYECYQRHLERCERHINNPKISSECLKRIDSREVKGTTPYSLSELFIF